MKNTSFILLCFLCLPLLSQHEVGKFKIGTRGINFLASNQLTVRALKDPDIKGATCFISIIDAKGLTIASDPSNASIACRQTGKISRSDLEAIDSSLQGVEIFSEKKGGINGNIFNLFKVLRIRRIFDRPNNTILYVTYTTRAFDGHFKNSLSAIYIDEN